MVGAGNVIDTWPVDVAVVSTANCAKWTRCSSTVLRKKPSNCLNSENSVPRYNANLDLLGFLHFITFKECRKVL